MSPLKSTFGAASAFGWIPRGGSLITGVESTLWAGGGTATQWNSAVGGSVIKYTNETLIPGTTKTVLVGAAGNSSTALGRTATTVNAANYGEYVGTSWNNVNGTVTTFPNFGSDVQRSYGYFDGRYYVMQDYQLGRGAPGAGGNGGTGFTNAPYVYSGSGGQGFTAGTGFGLTYFPGYQVGQGGCGYYNPSYSVSHYDTWYQMYVTFYLAYGTGNSAGAPNTGEGATAKSDIVRPASSGGFTMRYPNSFPALTSTTGDVVYANNGGYHNYFWRSTGGFTV